VAVLGIGTAYCAASEHRDVRSIAEAWAVALGAGDAKGYVAVLDVDRAT
jgi:hypothetical protein